MISECRNLQLVNYIQKSFLVSDEEIKEIDNIFKHEVLKSGSIFQNYGEIAQKISFINKGIFRYYYLDIDGNDRTKYFCKENDFVFNFESFIQRTPSMLYIETIEDCEIATCRIEEFKTLINSSTNILKIYVKYLEESYLVKEKRESEFLLYDALHRYLFFCQRYPDFETRINQYYIASYLGITPESLSRIRKQILNIHQ
jgi:CRP-like cAMP-binding protein